MDLTNRVAQLPPRRRRRIERLAVAAAVFCTVMLMPLLTMSVATIRLTRGVSTPAVALSAARGVAALLLCGVAALHALCILRVSRSPEASPSYGAISIVSRDSATGR